MNIGIIVYSQTGNTLSVAERLKEALSSKGHTASIERVEIVAESLRPALKTAPDTAPYDALVLASPVHAFTLAPAMKAYLAQLTDLSGKKVSCYVTMMAKVSWMGGNRAIRKITKACREKGAELISSGIVHWTDRARKQQIEDLIADLSSI